MVDAPTGRNNRANAYYKRQNNIRLARVDESREEFFGTIGGVPDSPYSVSIGTGPFTTGTLLTATPTGLVGGEVVTYQWQDDGVNIPGAISSTYTAAIGTDGVADASDIRVVMTVDGVPRNSAAREIRYPAGAFGALANQTFADDSGNQTYVFPAATGTGLTWTYSLVSPPAGVTIVSATRTITFDTDALAVQAGTPITVRATDQYGNAIDQIFTLTITEFAVNQTVDGEIEIIGGQPTSVTITSPAYYAGTYTTDVNGTALSAIDFSAGPACIIAPKIEQTNDADASSTINTGDEVGVGTPASADSYPGIWIYEAANGEPTISYQWQADTLGDATFANIGGATSSTYALAAGEEGDDVRLVETATDSGGARSANSNALSVIAASSSVDASVTATFNSTVAFGTSKTISGASLGAAAADREFIVFVGGRFTAIPAAGDWQMTVNGVSTTTEVIRQVPNAQRCVLAYRVSVPTGTSGDIVFARVAGSSEFSGGVIMAVRVTGTPTLGTPVVDTTGDLGFSPYTDYVLDANLNVAAGSAVAVIAGMTNATGVAFTGATEQVDGGSSQGGGAAAFVSDVAAATPRTINADFTGAASGNDAILVSVEIGA